MSRGTALVTGGGRGIGHAIARTLRRRGFAVAVFDQSPQPSEEMADVAYHSGDLAEIGGHEALLEKIERHLGPLTCLVNNAGVTSLVRGDMLDLTPESFDRCLDINLRGTFFLSQALARRLIGRQADEGHRSLINITSANAEILGENRADYCMSKAGLSMMSRLFAARLAEANIAVYEVRPGIIRTAMTQPAIEKYDSLIADGGVPAKRWGEISDVAETVASLACGALPFTTGTQIDVGGGLHLHRL